jgi:hypothetical protein
MHQHALSKLCAALTFAVVCAVLCGATALAQGGSTGSIAGTVADQSGAVVSNATVVVKNTQTGQEYTTTTSSSGAFTVPSLGSGVYTVTVTASGFKQAVATDVKVDVGKASSVNIALEVGAATDTVSIVGAGGELLQTQSATVGTTIVGRQIVEQPQASRDALDLVTLLPGVQTTGRPRTSTINGLPKGALNITLNGTDVQDNLISSQDGFFTFVRPRIDAIEEVTVSTATPGADSSGDGAVQIKFITRRGTNDYNGSLYWYHRNPALNANYYFSNLANQPRSRVLLNQYGGRVGGPISLPKLYNGKDRAFFFVNYEEFRLPEQQLRTRTILTPQAQAGVFSYLTGDGVRSVNLLQLAQANNLPSTVDPIVGKVLSDIRATTGQGTLTAGTLPIYQQFDFVGQGGQNRYFTTVRLDFNLSSKHQLENAWDYQEFGGKPVDFLNNTDPAFPGFPNSLGQNSQRWANTTALRSTFTNSLVNEIRFGMFGGISLFDGPGGRSQFDNQGGYDLNFFDLGITDASAVASFPQRGLRLFGTSTNRRNTPSFNLMDTVTWVKGNHSFTTGGSWNMVKSFQQDLNQLVPTVNFGIADGDPAEEVFFDQRATNFPGASDADLATAAQLYATLTGRVTAIDRTAFLEDGKYGLLGPQTTRFTQHQYALFVQDTWRARPNLTLNLGLRWEPQLPIVAKNRNFAKVSYEDLFGISGVGNLFKPGTRTGRATQFTELGVDEQIYDPDYNNFGPSVGVSWSPNFTSGLLGRVMGTGGQTVLRGGYSLAFVREGLGAYITPIQSNPGGVVVANRDTADGTLPIGTLLRNTSALAPPTIPAGPSYPIIGGVADAAFGFDPQLKAGEVHSFTFGIQREITKDTVFEARYVGTRARDLWRRYGLNEINVVENGFLNEFKLAQGNFAANRAAGRGNTFAYFGPGTGTSPLPIMLAFFSPAVANRANDPASYTSTQFRNATRLATLSPNSANPIGLANTLNTFFLGNAVTAGLPENFFVVNPGLLLGGVSLTTNDTDTWYDALQLEVRRRFSRGLLLQANYTWSKSLTNFFASSQTTLSQPLTLRPENERLERFRAPQDLQHAFKVNWIYELPFGNGRAFGSGVNGVVDRVIGGWEFHGTARVQSGRPFDFGNVQLVGMTAKELQDAIKIRKNNISLFTTDPKPVTEIRYLPDDIIINTRRAFNVSATSATGYGQLGVPTGRYMAPANSNGCVQAYTGQCGFSRLILDGPKFTRFDLSVVKKFKITEGSNFEFRAEFLNAFNNINFLVGGSAAVDVATVAGGQAGGAFGRVTTAYQDISTTNDPGGRLIQFVARINF